MTKNIKKVCLSFNGWEDNNPKDVVIDIEDIIYLDINNIVEHKVKYTHKNKHVFYSEKVSRDIFIHISPKANKDSIFEYMVGRDDLTEIGFINQEGEFVDSVTIPWADVYKDYKIDTAVNDNGDFVIGIKPCEIDWGEPLQ